ncbi:MAG: bifunctional acetate--CoA ligase family protein/GNAT family N-acetyltransferase [Proteobacteria bacterium]|nr:bifunctional acetate--CoA ligase family protein/GNAT family N-acetyltransferase [Pseudomonadota bacterium]
MTIRNLDAIFHPRSVALIGAGTRPRSVGAVLAENLRTGGFDGPVLPVNPKHKSVAGVLAYPDVASLPIVPDLAVICTPARTVPGIVAELGARGTRGAIVITAGFSEGGHSEGRALEQAMLDAARPHLMRIVGPNCLGVLSTPARLNASFAQTTPGPGGVAFVAQSGAMVTTVLDWAAGRGIGFSHLVSLGDMSDVDFGDMLDYLANDEATTAILLYIEAVTQARKFMSAARAAARLKPVIAIKAGRQAAAAKAASSHTGALAGIDAVYDAAFERAGILRAYDLDEVFDAVETLAFRPRVAGGRLTILTNGGGVGVLATDSLIAQGGDLAALSPETIAKLNAVLPPTWSHGNPVDIIGDADGKRYADALAILSATNEQDAILVLNCPTALGAGAEAAEAVVAAKARVPLLTNWLGAQSADEARRRFLAARIPTYDTPEKATRGFMHMVRYHRGQETLMEVPPALPEGAAPDRARANAILARAKPGWLDPVDTMALLAAYNIPVVRTVRAATPDEAAAQAGTAPIALKILSPDITHKSDVGGVALGLSGADAVRKAAAEMQARIAKSNPSARLEGFIVQEMIRRPEAYELILGMAVDRTFGPFLLFGQGGTAVEVIGDKALGLPPLNLKLAREMMARTRIDRLLKGYRDRPAADRDAIAATLVHLSQLISDVPQIAELDINPLLADEHGVLALDARIRIAEPASADRLAIRAYPEELIQHARLDDLGDFTLRPVRPEDAPAFERLFTRLAPEDVQMRFMTPLRALPPTLLARLTQIDYDREMAFVLVDASGEVAGVARLAADPDNTRAEFAIIVRSDLKGHGAGRLMMERLGAYARARGIGELWGNVLANNSVMLALCRELGCRIASVPEDPSVMRVALDLKAGG